MKKTGENWKLKTFGIFMFTAYLLAALPALVFAWNITDVDTIFPGGGFTSLALDSTNKAHISYWNTGGPPPTNVHLYAINASGTWSPTSISNTDSVGPYSSIAVDSADKPHLSYFDTADAGTIKYTTKASGSWSAPSIVDSGLSGNPLPGFSSIAVDSTGKPHICYPKESSLKCAAKNGAGAWDIATVDNSGNVGVNLSLAIDSGDRLHISYHEQAGAALKYATNATGTWVSTTVESTGGVAMASSALAIDNDGKVHIAFISAFGSSNETIKYATNASGAWVTTTVDGAGTIKRYVSIAVDSDLKAHLSYGESSDSSLKYATNASGPWVKSTIEVTGWLGPYSSIAVDSNNYAHVSYFKSDPVDPNAAYIRYATNAGIFKLPDTGQTSSYTGTFGEDHDYTINPPSFTDNGNGTITDNVTGLLWQKQDDGTTRAWDAAGPYCSGLNLGDKTGWRLPTDMELMSIVDYSQVSPPINATYFPDTKLSGYWISNTSPVAPYYPWYVSFSPGSPGGIGQGDNSYPWYTRCVWGGQLPSGNFIDNGDGTVSDTSSGLMWQQGEGGAMNWEAALNYCESSTLGGYTNWRLPNIKELKSLVDNTRLNPAIDPIFPDVHTGQWVVYWSSTTHAGAASEAWWTNFAYGGVYQGYSLLNGDGNKGVSNYVRCVRGGVSSVLPSDTTPPTTTASPSGGTYGSTQLVTLGCNDGAGSGCASTYYCTGSGCNPTTVYNGAISVSNSTTLRFYSKDNANNSETVKTATYTINSPLSAPTISVPPTNSTGSFVVSWGGGSVSGATYVREVSANGGAFTNVYTGTALSKSIAGLSNGSYIYRVKATKTGYAESGWRTSSPCVVTLALNTPTIYVPPTSSTGSFVVSWGGNNVGATYVLEVSANGGATFTNVYTGTALLKAITGLSNGSYIYRVKATKTGYVSTGWRTSSPCVVTLALNTPTIYVPPTSSTGSFVVSWGGGNAGATYVLEVSANGGATFTNVYTGTALSKSITGLSNGSYIYRVKATKTGYVSSGWRTSNPCVVTRS
ncbi:MAG: DUF1566 domain-containing protein [Nitrospirae bacterium]|nr:DUF1566 domain-containing protein [Nitrospirota bacterium]